MSKSAKILLTLSLALGALSIVALSFAVAQAYRSDWDSMDGADLASLAAQLQAEGDASADQRAELIDYVQSRFLSDATSACRDLALALAAKATNGELVGMIGSDMKGTKHDAPCQHGPAACRCHICTVSRCCRQCRLAC